MLSRLSVGLVLAGLSFATPALADFSSCLSGLRARALSAGISAETFDTHAANVSYDPELLGFLDAQPEFKTPIWDYLAALVDDERVADGRAQMRKHSSALSVASARYGVDAATIVAVWGVESDFGKSFGSRPIVKSLATLSCAGRRQEFFRGELIAALKILDAGDVDPAQFKGSWAGAFGHTQFMPSTFLRLAVDLDGDGRRDVIGSVPDALGSTANFLRKAGWSGGMPWGFEVKIPANYSGPSGRTNKQSMSSWAARGITRINGGGLGEGSAGLLLPAGRNGPAFLVTRNFDAIYSYNAAESYGLAIALLSDRLRGKGDIETPWPVADRGLSRAERREVQTLLMRRGYDLGGKAADGAIGTLTRRAIVDFQGRAGLTADGRPSESLLDALRSR